VVELISRLLYPHRQSPGNHLIGSWGGGGGVEPVKALWRSKKSFGPVGCRSMIRLQSLSVAISTRIPFMCGSKYISFREHKGTILNCFSLSRGRRRLSACRKFQRWNKATEFYETW
jgi:hypothetical protein